LKTLEPGQRARRLGTALLLLLLPALPAQARGKSEAWANTQFSNAERMREALNNLPAADRSRREYQRVVIAYRRVYYGAPAAGKADPSVFAVATLLTEMGRRFDSPSELRAAIGQYQFLRREYPGSRDRFEALFNIAQIYQDDLKDPAQAKPVFEEFLRRYPRNRLADAARQALNGSAQEAALGSKADSKLAEKNGKLDRQKKDDDDSQSQDDETSRTAQAISHGRSSKLSRITSVRHWSSQNYTRVAIDLDQGTKFESQRIENPERIFFDLQDTNLASNLLGKTFDVEDGLLKKIRVAQFQPGKSRIVLEVAERSDYDTFLLTDPPRLIVDIHNSDIHNSDIHNNEVQSKDAYSNNARSRDIQSPEPESQDVPGAAAPDAARAVPHKPAVRRQPVQAASLKQAEPVDDLPAKPPVAEASVSGPKKTVVEAEDSDDDGAVTVAKLDPPEIRPKTRAASTLSPPTARNSAKNKRKATDAFPDVREASPTASGDRSLIRALGLKIGKIVIDPGHGGHDTGTIGPKGLEEKDLVLDVGRRLGKLLQARLGADVVYTRKDDTYIPLETRTSIANQEQADLFVSIHANSSRDPDARGVETYYLNFTSSPEALDVAARENAASDKSIHELQDLVKKIALKEKIEESREFASNVQRALHTGLAAKSPGIRDRGVKKAPFIVLIGANMPSILAEISFVSNPGDERRLETAEYRQRIAESLYRGISKYVSGLSGIKVASKIDKGEGQ
jgi:N-acetylmuramoyl-L-alanine amidase